VLKLGIHDSKQLTARTRESLCDPIRTHARAWAIESGSVEEINSDGIVTAIERAVIRVVDTIVNTLAPDTRILVLTDSLPVRRLTRYPQQAVPHGDATCVCIAAASVIAKVARDRHMSELHTIHPHYAWNMNKGYATRTHRSAIQQHGPSPLHRLLFIRNILST
jgi:ribonuclease HII